MQASTTEADDDAVVPSKTPTDSSSRRDADNIEDLTGVKSERKTTRRLLKSLAKSMQPSSHMTRRDHMHKLYLRRRVSVDMIRTSLSASSREILTSPIGGQDKEILSRAVVPEVPPLDAVSRDVSLPEDDIVVKRIKSEVGNDEGFKVLSARMQEIVDLMKDYQDLPPVDTAPLEIRVTDLTYTVMVDTEPVIETVFNTSALYPIYKWYKEKFHGEKRRPRERAPKKVLDHISLMLKPGKMYLVLGPPAAGKSSLLQAIIGLLKPRKGETLEGSVLYNGRELKDADEFHIENAFGYIDQLDKHAPRYTVGETMEFAFQCKTGGKYIRDEDKLVTPEAQEANKRASQSGLATKLCLTALGLTGVKDTFVGDTNVRGVSGGQRRRVTVGEMLMSRTPVLCGDEISTGLDAASTFDMIQLLLHIGKQRQFTRIISLLQPSPETVSLFDEVILLGEGMLLYAGPVVEVEEYFAEIGFNAPDYMDVADFLQMISTEEGATLYSPDEELRRVRPDAPSIAELAEVFRNSKFGARIRTALARPPSYVWKQKDSVHGAEVSKLGMTKAVNQRYANNFFRSTYLILKRFLVLWIRDKRVIIAGAVKNILMGVSVGGVFNNTTDPISLQGALFQAGLFIMLGAMQSSMGLVEDRIVFYKHKNANFYSAWPFVFGRTISQIPQTILDTLMFGVLLYYIVGLGGRDDVSYLFTYLAILFVFALLMNQQLSVIASFASASSFQGYSAGILLLCFLFGGFIVSPDSIPKYYWWLYWWNPFAWMYRSLVVLEFRSSRWEDPDDVLSTLGFVTPDGEAFGSEWIGYGFSLMVPYFLACCILTALGLTFIQNEGDCVAEPKISSRGEDCEDGDMIAIPFKPVTLSFQDICYEVTASTKKEKLLLLNNVNGILRAGRMCALMGESGAGKTTLMDVIALRKRSGTITGEVALNGFQQDPISFRRCSGYVEQFDVQSPQLSVKETIVFSARLRIDPSLVPSDDDILKFVDHIMDEVELSSLAAVLVGTDESGGLSFEQKKRLSIAVELAASPSVIFLDEPTSGLDARSALLVVNTLRKIADSGRTVCATIHQPSSTVFNMFDDLLLLKRGGKVVYHGELGSESKTLVSYFESKGAPKCEPGENPANWMLRVMSNDGMGDLAVTFADSEEFAMLSNELAQLKENRNPDDEIKFDSEFAVSGARRNDLVNRRLRTIYWRSPTYNLVRMTVSVVIAFILGSVFILDWDKRDFTEVEMRDRLSVIFLSFIMIGILACLSVIPVMTMIRDMYYRHRDAGMYGSGAIGLALGVAEKWFLVVGSILFTAVFLATSHIGVGLFSVGFWGYFTFNFALYSYFGQSFVCLVKPKQTAFILASVLIGLNNFFSGLIVRPQFMVGTFFALPYYITPGHYVYEGLVFSLYDHVEGTVTAEIDSEFYEYLVEQEQCSPGDAVCRGTVKDYVQIFFGGEFSSANHLRNALILGGMLVLVRVVSWLALQYVRFA